MSVALQGQWTLSKETKGGPQDREEQCKDAAEDCGHEIQTEIATNAAQLQIHISMSFIYMYI
eukprot:11543083-Karenia_brevis.AAC.1